MDIAALKEKLRSLSPLEFLKKGKDVLLAFCSNVLSMAKGLPGRLFGGRFSAPSGEAREDGPSPFAQKKRLVLFGLAGAAVIIIGLIITVIVVNAPGSEGTRVFNVAAGLSIPAEELFYPQEPDFLPGLLQEKESRRFWSLDDIRQYWKTPGNPDWWMEEIKTTVDKLMEGIP